MRSFVTRITIIAVAAGLLAGCGNVTERVTEEVVERAVEEAAESSGGADADVNLEDGSVSIEGGSGNISVGGDLPDDWPEDLPVPDGTEVLGASMQEDDTYGAALASLQVPDGDVDEIASFYEEALADEGWQGVNRREMGSPDNVAVSAGKPDENRNLAVSVTDVGDGRVSVHIDVRTEKDA